MTRFRPLLPAALLAALLLPLAAMPGQASPEPRQRWIVRFHDARAMAVGAASLPSTGRGHRFTAVFPGVAVELSPAEAARLRARPGVAAVRPDRRVRASGVQANPPAALDRVDQRTAFGTRSYTSTMTGRGVRAYVVDSGLNTGHADFTGRVAAGPNYVEPGTAPVDCAGHGTHVAGILAGTRHGVAKQATLVPVKVLDCAGMGYESDTLAAMDWVVRNHAAGTPAVLNMSLDGEASAEMTRAAGAVIADGITLVAAAGNALDASGPTSACKFGPANVPAVVTVANATTTNVQSPTSNFGSCVDLYAPGESVASAWIGSATATATSSGTSMAAPFVSGAAALLLQARPAWTPAQVSSQLLSQATPNVILRASAGTPNRMLYTLGPVTPGTIEKAPAPTVSGTARVGQRLVATPGTWGNGTVTLRLQWYRVSSTGARSAITGATGTAYTVTTADRSQRIQVAVTGSKRDYASRTTFSPATAAVA